LVLATVASAKSPVVAIALMVSGEPPVFWTVTVFAAAFLPTRTLPHVSEVGVTTAVGPVGFTVRLKVVVCVIVPDTPVTVTVDVPAAAPLPTVRVSVLVVFAGFGLKPAVTPLGKPEALKVALPLKPLIGVTVIVLVPWLPCVTVRLFGLALSVKVATPVQLGNANDEMLVDQSNTPVTAWY